MVYFKMWKKPRNIARNVTKEVMNLLKIDRETDKIKKETGIIKDIRNIWGMKREMKTIKK